MAGATARQASNARPHRSAGRPTAQAAKTEEVAGGTAETDVALAVPPASAYSADHPVRTGDPSLRVARGTLLSTVDRVTSLTTAAGGYVLSSAVGR